MSAKLTSQRRISPHEGQERGSIGPASAAASFGWRNGCASPGEGVDSCRQRSQIGNPGLDGIFSFSILPLRMASFAGLGALSVACCYLLYALYARFVLNESPAGFTALIFFRLFRVFSGWPTGSRLLHPADPTSPAVTSEPKRRPRNPQIPYTPVRSWATRKGNKTLINRELSL